MTQNPLIGTWRLVSWVNRVIHHIKISSFPNWAGVDQERIFELKGNKLLLSTPPLLLSGKQQTAHPVWERD